MRQIWITRWGPPEVLDVREAPDPEPGSNEVRIRVAYAGVNFADVLARLGLYPDAPKPPCVVGYEVSGVVDQIGRSVDDGLGGKRVVATTRFGGYSQFVCVPADRLIVTPEGVSDEAAAALPVNYLTAHHMLVRLANVQAGETVLVHGAGGGVGVAAIQLCQMLGARVIGTASPGKHDFLRRHDVEPVNYRETGWTDRILDLTDGRGVDVALDPIGGASFMQSYELLAPGGRLCCFGDSATASAGTGVRSQTPSFDATRLMDDNRGVFGVNLGHLWKETSLLGPQLNALLEHAAAHRIAPVVDSTFAFEHAAQAHRQLEDRKNIGKVLLVP